jgi:hypothetical protein
MIADQQARYEALMDAGRIVEELRTAYQDGTLALTKALAEAGGYEVGQIIKLTDGREARIHHIRLTDGEELIASCHDRTLSGKWSQRARLHVKLKVKIEEPS